MTHPNNDATNRLLLHARHVRDDVTVYVYATRWVTPLIMCQKEIGVTSV